MEKTLCITRPIDGVGRLVIPKPLRQLYGIQDGDTLWCTAVKDGILLTPVREDTDAEITE